jgi:L-threonylcarbamoyladenylate synthase
MIEESTNLKVTTKSSNIRVSGSLESHYAPKAKVLINQIPKDGYGFIALSNIPTPEGCIRLTSPNTLEEYARDLYSALRLADLKEIKNLVAITPESAGLAEAISDRLQRASNS